MKDAVTCAHCGQAIAAHGAMLDLAAQIVTDGHSSVRLTRMEAITLAALSTAFPSAARHEAIMDATHPEMKYPPHSALKVRIFHLRRKLRAVGVEVRTVPRSGYRLVAPVHRR